ncbi:aminopeptidase N [Antricoccus suffuscus]|uniref:Aminopeptidase N n=1 Tax=Antricoccus suffuscus TaxID=1629062 RepID=A0A2T0ZVQ7_9ACTN|nr:aminopeptidase N [Antricoccus suffuscus]PRZ40429.1 aminopeptidase N [Antricoccus suffuscus]
MAHPNLTRDDAKKRSATIRTTTYDVTIDLTDGAGNPGDRTFRSTTVLTFDAEPGSSTFVDVVADSFHTVTLNGEPVSTAGYAPETGIVLDGLTAHNELVVDAELLYTNTGEGLHRFVDPTDDAAYVYSQFETAFAKLMYACFDQPDLKAAFTFHVTAPAHWEVVSNGAVDNTSDGPGGAKVIDFATTKPISPYITALIAGPLHVVRDHHKGIDLGIYCRASLAKHLDADEIFEVTKQGFDFFQELFDFPYAFGKYDQLFVPEFNFGAMENAGAVTFRDDYVFQSKVTEYRYERRAETILHEMAHMWFGDLVTMRWWDDLWLNESFATYASVHCQAEATKYKSAWTTFANVEKTWAYDQDTKSSTHPVAADMVDIQAVEVNFDGITYAKGASVLKQLVAYVGQDEFFAGIRAYFKEHQYGNTELADLFGALEKSSGRDLSWWSAQWLETSQVNTLRPIIEVDEHEIVTKFEIEQTAVPEHPTLRTHRLAVGGYSLIEERLVRTERIELDISEERTAVPGFVGQKRPSVVLLNDDDLTYAKVRFDEQSLAFLLEHIDKFTESLPRTLCWSAAWDMTRDGEMRARDFVALVRRGITSETTMSVVQSLIGQAQGALASYADPTWAPTGWAEFADTALYELHNSEPGSDLQVTWSRAFASAATTDEQLARLEDIVRGEVVLDGLAMDLDTRWALLTPLIAVGRAGETEIAAELTTDSSDVAARRAATARALIPSADNKERVWRETVTEDALTNYMHEATALGFYSRHQRELTKPFVPRYFEALDTVWQKRPATIAQQVTELMYPRIIEQATVDATDAWLAGDGHASSQARLVGEERDGIVRALNCRKKDAEPA